MNLIKRFIVTAACTTALLFGVPTPQLSSWVTVVTAQKTVHVKGYTKKDGTVVAPYDRSAPKSKSGTSTNGTSGAAKPATTTTTATAAAAPTSSTACAACPRDKNGRILRSEKAKADFMRLSGYPRGRAGYVVDHIIPLACGGPDVPTNMQWQTLAASKLKDKEERDYCH